MRTSELRIRDACERLWKVPSVSAIAPSYHAVVSRPCDHTDFLTAQVCAVNQLGDSWSPLLIKILIVKRQPQYLFPQLVVRTQDATSLNQSSPRHFHTLARIREGNTAGLNPQLALALQDPALVAGDFACAAIKDRALKDVRAQMRTDTPVYRAGRCMWESATQERKV